MTYPSSFRCKVLSVRKKEGLTIAQAATRFCVGIASMTRRVKNPNPRQTRNKPATKIDMIALARDMQEFPDAYQAERPRRLGVSEKGIGHALRRMNISYKKILQHPKADEDKRHTFQETIKAYEAQNRVIVSIDEHSFAHDMPEHMGMHPLANGVTVCVIGMPEAASM
jgi:transposase